MRATNFGAFVPLDAEPSQVIDDLLNSGWGITFLVGVLDAEHEGAAHFFGEKPVEKSGPGTTDMQVAGR